MPNDSFPSARADGETAAVTRAIARAVHTLRARQSPDGAWRSVCDQGPATTAQAAIVLAWIGRLSVQEGHAICAWLTTQQRADGGWASGPLGDTSELGATAIAYAALVRLGGEEAARTRARAYLDDNGGLRAAGARVREADAAPWYLALAGVLDGRELPRFPLAWRRSPTVVRWLETQVHDGVQLLITQLGAIGRRLSGAWGERPAGPDRADADAVLALLDLYQNPDGSWGGFVPIHSLALAAAWACGDRGPRVERGVAWLRSRLRSTPVGVCFDAYDPDIWVTAISLRALRLSGAPADDPAVRAAAGHLLRGQSLRPQAPGLTRRPRALRVGGWGFGAENVALPDTDDTGEALLALSLVAPDPAITGATALGEAWLRDMQNPDGAFPAFTWNVARRPAGALDCPPPGPGAGPLRRLRALVPHLTDYPSEDAVGRILRAFAARGAGLGDPAVDGAVAWLRRQQCAHGGWWGRWVTPYVAGTADVLLGLHAVGVPSDDPMVRPALEFLLARQHPDGGWGETPDAYLDPASAGAAPSNATLTGWVLPGLLPWLGAQHAAAKRAVHYLLTTQLPDGDWPQGNHVHMYLVPDRAYRLPASALMHPLEALASWRRAGG